MDAIVGFVTDCHEDEVRLATAAVEATIPPAFPGGERRKYDWGHVVGFIVDEYTDPCLDAGHAHALHQDPRSTLLRVDAERNIVLAYLEREREGSELPVELTDGEVDGLGLAIAAMAWGRRDRDGFNPAWFDSGFGPL